MKKILLVVMCIFTFSNSTPLTISPVEIPDEFSGIYKATNYVLVYNGVTYTYNESELEGTYMLVGKDGTYSSTALINGVMATTFGYITSYTSTSVTTTNILDGSSKTESYQLSNDILTMSSSDLTSSYTLSAKKVIQVDMQSSTNVNITTTYLDSLPSGWTLSGTNSSISDLKIFDNVQVIWIYNNKEWNAYSPNLSMSQNIQNSNIDIITTIPQNSGVWIYK